MARRGLIMAIVWMIMANGVVVLAAVANNRAADIDKKDKDIDKTVDGIPARDDFLVQGLEELEPAFASFDGTMYAGPLSIQDGYYDVGTSQKSWGDYMFWLFQPDAPTDADSLVVWFNGGPGCSSFHAGLFFENGPVTSPLHPAGYFSAPTEVNDPYQPNEYAWTKRTTMLYVEQPVPVGFSHGTTDSVPHNETDVGRFFYGFLQNFMTVFPEQRAKRLFLVGESYAGYYVPAVGHYIFQQNQQRFNSDNPERLLNLKGIAIGNGWADVTIQGPMVIDYAWWHGMIDSVTRDAFHAEWDHCKQHIYDSSTTNDTEPAPFHRFTVPDECGIMNGVLSAAGAGLLHRGSPNTYDVTTWDPYDVLNAVENPAVRFFNDPKVQEALNVPHNSGPWMGCIPGAGRRRLQKQPAAPPKTSEANKRMRRKLNLLDDDRPISTAPYMADLLDKAGINVLVYNGDRDMSTCSQGSEVVLNEMEWSGQSDWLNPDFYDRGLWLVDGEMSGYAKVVGKLQFVVVYNSGHLVPHDRPRISLDLVERIVTSQSFMDKKIPTVYKIETDEEVRDARPRTGWSRGSNLEETIILVFLAFAFGYATAVILARLQVRCFGMPEYERIPSHHSGHHSHPRNRH